MGLERYANEFDYDCPVCGGSFTDPHRHRCAEAEQEEEDTYFFQDIHYFFHEPDDNLIPADAVIPAEGEKK